MVLILDVLDATTGSDDDVSVPLRGLWFLSKSTGTTALECPEVSVPLRGLWFLSRCRWSAKLTASIRVSVPLRGLWFLSLTCWMQPPDPMMMFPSPCGDYGSYRNQQEQQHWSARRFPSPCGDYGSYRGTKINAFIVEVSVPLRGLWFLSNTDFSSNRKVRVVSVPLRGLWFLSVGKHDLLRRLSICFRPLAGIMVLIVIH